VSLSLSRLARLLALALTGVAAFLLVGEGSASAFTKAEKEKLKNTRSGSLIKVRGK
jgi:hypothetical protein